MKKDKMIVKIVLEVLLDVRDNEDNYEIMKKIIEWFNLDIGWFNDKNKINPMSLIKLEFE